MFEYWQQWRDTNNNANKRLWTNKVQLNSREQFIEALHKIFPVSDGFQFKANQLPAQAGESEAEKKERRAKVKKCLKFTSLDELREKFSDWVQTPSETVFPERIAIRYNTRQGEGGGMEGGGAAGGR
jgi:hypothetical protein